MATPDEFAQACRQTSRQLRRLPKDLRRELGQRVKPEVAEPLAQAIGAAFTGPHAARLSAGTKARVAGDPQVVVGGARRVFSGGASVRNVVFGDEFGHGDRVTAVPARAGRRGYRRHTTRQFPRSGRRAVFGTVARRLEDTFDRWSSIVDDVLKGVTTNG